MLCCHRPFFFAVVLLSYLCGDSTALKPKISTLTGEWADEWSIVIREGEPLGILCSGNSDLFFVHPTNRTRVFRTLTSYTSPIEISKNKDENGTYLYKLYRPNTIFGDTGWYGCSYQPIPAITMDTYAHLESSLIYVYVESIIDQFVEQADSHVLVIPEDEAVIIPCRPTAPRTKVEIRKISTDKFRYADVPGPFYDSKFGFMLNPYERYEKLVYMCSTFTSQHVTYIVRLQDIKLPEPKIINNTLLHAIKGESLYLKCTILFRGWDSDYNVFWIISQQSDRITAWNDSRAIKRNVFEKMALLEIRNVTYEDAGIYECKSSGRNNEKRSEMVIQVHESIDPFINLTTQDPNRHYERYKGDEVEFVVDVDAYPSAELKWLNTHGDEIIKSSLPPEESKFLVDTACCKPILRIYSLDLNDMGKYSIQATNQYKNESLNFTLEIITEPKVLMSKPDSYYFQNQVAKVKCHVDAYPKPNITWSYRKCPNCGDGTVEYLTNFKESETVTHLVSTVWATIETSGEINCRACNKVGCGNVTEKVSVYDEFAGFGIVARKDPVAEGDEWELICAASVHNYLNYFDWSTETGRVVQSDRISIVREKTESMYRSILMIHNVTVEDSQEYICTAMSTDNRTLSGGYRLEVKVARAPFFINTNMRNDEITIDLTTRGRKIVDFQCFADGMPKPNISWFKDGVQILVSNEKHTFSNSFQKLVLEYPLESDSGKYICRAENRIGKAEMSERITVKGFGTVSKRSVALIVSVVMLAVIVLILVIYFALKVRRDRLMRQELMEAGLMHFEKGAVESLNPDLTVDDQADLLPYDNKWEFPKEKLKLGNRLGSGAFGVVLKAEALGIRKGEAVTTVAVKTIRRGPNLAYICALANELKIMVHLGKHLNVVNLLGACTKNILKGELLVIVEFCRFGNLQNYLFRHRSSFINQIDPATGKLDLSIGRDLLTRTAGACSTSKIKSVELSPSVSINCNLESDSVQYHATADPALDSGYIQPGWSNCRGDYKDSNLKPICTQDLLSWAFQVARGMEYLSQRRILHGDLAGRNILLAHDNVVKICDFGLAKSMYKEDIYKKSRGCLLPIKWLAVETMRDRIFSTQSDIWSFGIVLWEFFSLAETPYPGIETEILYQKLIQGYRMEQPEYANPEVYDIMCQCWNAKPSLRPSFTKLVDSVGNMLEQNARMHYIELNAPYHDMNRTMLEGGRNDLLTMVSAPDYVAVSASGATKDSDNLCTSSRDTAETLPMLNNEEEDPYLKPIDVHSGMES